jgi:glycosyltransferase involved in cell wall biosynthesis
MIPLAKERYDIGRKAKAGMSFLVPAFNEEQSVTATLSRLSQMLLHINLPYEIILVNDGSTDRTGELARSVPGIKIIEHPLNIGYGNSIKDAVLHAQFDWIGIVDADGSYPIEDLHLLVRELHNGFDMVVARRTNLDKIDSVGKRISRSLLQLLVNFLNDRRIEDPNSGFRVMRRSLLLSLMPFLCGTFSFTTSLTILASGLAYFIKYVPVKYNPRLGKSKIHHFRDSLRTLQYVVQGIVFFNPIKF